MPRTETQSDAARHALPPPPLPQPPTEPEPFECCGNGCDYCVWTVYFEQLAEYEEALAEREAHARRGGDSRRSA